MFLKPVVNARVLCFLLGATWRAVRLPMSAPLPPEFEALASAMPPTVRNLLVDGHEPSEISVDMLLADLSINPRRHLLTADLAKVVHTPSALSANACAKLRAAVGATANI